MPSLQDTSKAMTDRGNNADLLLTKALLPSILGIVICIILLCGTTFAWLTDSVHTGGSTLTAGNFSVSIAVNNATVSGTQVELQPGQEYTVSMTKTGTAVSGYAILTVENSQAVAAQSYMVDTFPATVSIKTAGVGSFSVRLMPYWGTKNDAYPHLPVKIDLTETDAASKEPVNQNDDTNGGQ